MLIVFSYGGYWISVKIDSKIWKYSYNINTYEISLRNGLNDNKSFSTTNNLISAKLVDSLKIDYPRFPRISFFLYSISKISNESQRNFSNAFPPASKFFLSNSIFAPRLNPENPRNKGVKLIRAHGARAIRGCLGRWTRMLFSMKSDPPKRITALPPECWQRPWRCGRLEDRGWGGNGCETRAPVFVWGAGEIGRAFQETLNRSRVEWTL